MKLADRILADLDANGPADHLTIARRLGYPSNCSNRIRNAMGWLANFGRITFDETGRIATLTPTTNQEPTT